MTNEILFTSLQIPEGLKIYQTKVNKAEQLSAPGKCEFFSVIWPNLPSEHPLRARFLACCAVMGYFRSAGCVQRRCWQSLETRDFVFSPREHVLFKFDL